MELDQALDDREPHAEPAPAAVGALGFLGEDLEDVRQEVGPDARAMVGDRDRGAAVGERGEAHRHPTRGGQAGAELDRVVQQLGDRLR